MSTEAAVAVLQVEDLDVATASTALLSQVRFSIDAGERVGLIGESGSGKSLTALAIMGLLPDGVHAQGQVRMDGQQQNLLEQSARQWAALRGDEMTMVFQEPMTALNPTMRVGAQVAEVIRLHRSGVSRGEALQRAGDVLDQVGLKAGEVSRAYPHQLSGGQRQRVVIAIALACDPRLLICDEPSTALDVTVQARVLDLIVDGVRAREAALLFITHDLAVVAQVCERVLVMYGGRIVESGTVREVFSNPRHRYTAGLLAASDLTSVERGAALPTIEGTVPPAGRFPSGCVFRSRCSHASSACEEQPPWTPRSPGGAGSPASGFACVHPVGTPDD
ncbi:MAG: ABC transporter ATP-binding protein [Ornithinimicrobium sp.]